MKIIKSEVEYWLCPNDWRTQVARAARVCYGHDSGKRTAKEMCEMLEKNGHLSMFRHGTVYFVFTSEQVKSSVTIAKLLFSSYVGITYKRDRKDKEKRTYFVAMNVQAYSEISPQVHNELEPCMVSLEDYVFKAKKLNHYAALSLIRYTLCVTTQISTSRELNRTSPNNIAEQSTRYVNFGKRGGITICEPHWYAGHSSSFVKMMARLGWRLSEFFYNFMLKHGMKAQDARGFLPLDTATRVVYTYNVFEWRHILELRLLGTTGAPHPNAKMVAQMMSDELEKAICIVTGNDNFKII